MAKSRTKQIKQALMEGRGKKRSGNQMLSSGINILNLMLSGSPLYGYPTGTLIHCAGSSDSGKTVLALTGLAEASINPHFDKYDLRFWNAEDGAQMDRELFYGTRAAKRLIEEVPEYLDEFYFSVLDALNTGRPFVGVVDSMDVLFPKAWEKKLAKDKAAFSGKDVAGDYGGVKPKMNSEYLRKIRSGCAKTGSILILVSQTRDNLAAGPFGDKTSVSGGHAYKFYSVAQIFTSTRQTLYTKALGKDRAYGIQAQIQVKKNHISGRKGKILAPILNDYGIDNIGASIDFLVNEGYWSSSAKGEGKGKISAPEFCNKAVPRNKLARIIEEKEGEKQLRTLIRKIDIEIQEALQSNRKSKYD